MNRLLALILLAGCKFEAPDNDTSDPSSDAPSGACEGIPVEGICQDAMVARCVDGAIEHEICGFGCGVTTGVATCNALDCSTVGPLGRCDGEHLARCDTLPAVTTDCAATGQQCGYVDDVSGYQCVDSGALASKRITGTIRWEDRPLSPGQLGAAIAMPARGVMVAILDDATDATLTTTSTADDGTYVAHYEATANVRVVAYSRSRSEARPARVRDAQGYLHALGSESFAAGDTTPVDITITAASSLGGAWNALDNAITAMDWLRARGMSTISPVFMYWQLGSATGSYYQGGDNSLHLDGDDGFDDVVALHELGHYMQDEYSASENPGGAHDGSPADPRLAWGEGGATWFAIAIRGSANYIDYSAGGGWSVELEDRVHAASMAGGLSQRVSEWMVAELMYDVGDAAGGDDDAVTASHPEVFDVMTGYMTSSQMSSRGFSGVDLVEFLDGWFMTHGMASCSAMRSLLVDHYKFPYDFSGPAGDCP